MSDNFILSIKGLKLKNDMKKVSDRELALDICEINIYYRFITFILGDRGAGKSPLKFIIEKIFDNTLNQCDSEILKIDKWASWTFHGLSGNPSNFDNLKKVNTVFFCDDSCHDHISTGVELIKKAEEYSPSLIVSVDPDRLEEVLKYYLQKSENRHIIWLSAGRIFWDGTPDNFFRIGLELCEKYLASEPRRDSTQKFIQAIRSAITQN